MSEPSASSSATAQVLALAWTGKRLPLLRSAAATTSARKTTKARYRGSPSSISRTTSQHSAPWIPMRTQRAHP